MPHIDEGTLHALLDGALPALADAGALPPGGGPAEVGAHLRACADCRARLEAERAIREQAGEVLKDAGVIVAALPPFEELVPRPRPPAPLRGWVPLAWAASLVLALGAGWSANMLLRGPAAELASEELRRESAPAQPGAAGAGVADAEAEMSTPSGVVAPAAGAPAAAVAAGLEPGRAAGDARPDRVTDAAAARGAAGAGPEPVAAPITTPAPPSTAVAKTVDAAPQANDSPASRVVPLEHVAPPAMAQRAPSDPPVTAEPVAEDRAVMAFAAGAGEPSAVRAAMRQADAGQLRWRALEEEAAPGEAALVVRDGDEYRIETAPLLGATFARVNQRVDGVGVEIYTWREVSIRLEQLAVTSAPAPRERAAAARELAREPLPAMPVPTAPPAQRRTGETPRPVTAQPGVAAAAPVAPAPLITTVVSESVLPDGVRELVVHAPAAGAYVVLRGALTSGALAALARQLVPAQ